MLNIALVSTWHVHTGGYAAFVQGCEDARLTCVWDARPDEGQKWAEKLGIEFVADLDALLARADVDAVIVDAPTSDHKDVMLRAAKAKKHIFTEKAMALTVADCDEITRAVEENGIKFVISFPQRTLPWAQYVKKALEDGVVGRPSYLRIRDAHGGASQAWLPEYWYDAEKAGGGAMMDLGCHPNYLASYLLGRPKRVTSIFNTLCCPKTMEDNAVSVVEFENGCVAVLETGFVTPWSQSPVELQGTDGTIVVEKDGKIRVHSTHVNPDGWFTPDRLPENKKPALRQFIDAVLYGGEIEFGTAEGRALTELLEKEYIAHNEGRTVAF